MAINKVIANRERSHSGMKQTLDYILRNDKTPDKYIYITGPYNYPEITSDNICNTWIKEKKLWGKDNGRMYSHMVISFHKEEDVTPQVVLKLAKTFVNRFFPNHQVVISVHQDKGHLHAHLVINSVSWLDGHKLHQTWQDLDKQKKFTNFLCAKHSLSVTKKGYHFDGTAFESLNAWSKEKYNYLKKFIDKQTGESYLENCALALNEVLPYCTCKEDFVYSMLELGWTVKWEDKLKHICFTDQSGNKVRDRNISQTFNLPINKEGLLDGFRNNLSKFRTEIDSATQNDSETPVRAIRNNPTVENRSGQPENYAQNDPEEWTFRGYSNDTKSLIREVRTVISDSQSQTRAIISSNEQSMARERQSIINAEQRRLEEKRRTLNKKRAEEARSRLSNAPEIER